jgi:hypothetical protein
VSCRRRSARSRRDQSRGRGGGARVEVAILGLRQIDDAPVIAEIVGQQLGMTVETEAAYHERLEMTDQIVGEIEGPRFGVVERGEFLEPGVEGVAMIPGDTFDAGSRQHPVERAAGTAIAVEAEDPRIAIARGGELGRDRFGDPRRRVVQDGRQALEIDMGPAVERGDRQHLARKRAAGDDQRAWRPLGWRAHPAAWRLCRRAIRSLAVWTATAASRQ